jgi:hypothetical protein
MARRTSSGLLNQVDQTLIAHGFMRRGATWNRMSAPFTDVIDLQLSKSGDMVTMNLGVFDPQLYELCWREEAGPFIQEPQCIVRARLGWLTSGIDSWWDAHADATASELIHALVSAGLPFLQSMHDLGAMSKHLEATGAAKSHYPPPAIYLAGLKSGLGDHEGACSVLRSVFASTISEPWKRSIGMVGESLECQLPPYESK